MVSSTTLASSFTTIASSTITHTPSLVSSATSATATCTTAVPGKYGYVDPTACNAQWNFNPSYSAAVAFSVFFGIVTAGHVVEAFLYKKVGNGFVDCETVYELLMRE